jgi:hypothetical protein
MKISSIEELFYDTKHKLEEIRKEVMQLERKNSPGTLEGTTQAAYLYGRLDELCVIYQKLCLSQVFQTQAQKDELDGPRVLH